MNIIVEYRCMSQNSQAIIKSTLKTGSPQEQEHVIRTYFPFARPDELSALHSFLSSSQQTDERANDGA